jgi:hypothetical protein
MHALAFSLQHLGEPTRKKLSPPAQVKALSSRVSRFLLPQPISVYHFRMLSGYGFQPASDIPPQSLQLLTRIFHDQSRYATFGSRGLCSQLAYSVRLMSNCLDIIFEAAVKVLVERIQQSSPLFLHNPVHHTVQK